MGLEIESMETSPLMTGVGQVIFEIELQLLTCDRMAMGFARSSKRSKLEQRKRRAILCFVTRTDDAQSNLTTRADAQSKPRTADPKSKLLMDF